MADETSTPPQENFAAVIEKVTKRPSGGKPKEVLAVQIVDKAGKHAGPGSKGGTRISDEAAEIKDAAKIAVEQTVLLEDIVDATETSAEQPAVPEAEQTATPEESEEDKAKKIAQAEAAAKLEAAIRELTKDSLRGSNRLVALTEEGLEGREEEKKGLEGREEQLKALKESIEKAGGTAEDSKKYNKMQYELKKDELALRLKNATTPAARKQIRQEQKALAKEHGSLLGKMASGLSDMKDKMLEPVKGAGKGIMAMLKGTLIAGALLAVMGFLNSEYWKKTKKFIVDDVVPVLMDLYENILKPIGVIIADAFVKTWKNIKELFSGLGEAFDMFAEGDWFGGIIKIITSIGSFLGNLLDDVLTAVWNTIATVFGMSKTDSVFGSIWGFFTDTYDEIVSWISITWFNIKTTISKVWTDIKDAALGIFTGIKEWFTKMFDFGTMESAVASVINIVTFIPNLVKDALLSITSWLLGLFGFSEAAKKVANAKKWTIGGMVVIAFKAVKDWFLGLFGWGKTDEDAAAKDEGGKKFSLFGTISGVFTGIWTWIKELFTDPVAALKKLLMAYIGVYIAIGTFIWDKAIKPVWTWIKGLFGFKSADAEDEDSKKGVLGFIKDLALGVWKWFKGLFDFSSVGAGFASIINLITLPHQIIFGLVMGVWNWFKGLFGFDTKDTTDADKQTKPGGIGGIMLDLITAVWTWFKGLFAWGKKKGETAAGDFSLWKMITGIFKSIKTWFTDTFKFDFSGLLDSLPEWIKDPKAAVSKLIKSLTKFLPSWLGGPDKSEADLKKEAEELAAKDKKKQARLLEIRNKAAERRQKIIERAEEELAQSKLFIKTGGKEGKDTVSNWGDDVAAEQGALGKKQANIDKLIAQNEKAKALDAEFKKKATTKSKDSSIFTHDQGLHDRLDRIFPPENNVERTKQMKEASLAKGAAAGGGAAPVIVNAPSNSSSTKTNVTNVSKSLGHPSPVINAINAAA